MRTATSSVSKPRAIPHARHTPERRRVVPSRLRFVKSIADIDAASWNRLAGNSYPFLQHEFLLALEQSGCAPARTGWAPRHAVWDDGAGHALAALPLYRKSHSRGEFVFDFSWANAYAQHGLDYYPKLLCAVPFTPVRGARLLTGPGTGNRAVTEALIEAAAAYARSEKLSSWHVLLPSEDNLAP